MYQIGFVIEHILGHVTHAHNLQRTIRLDSQVHPHWALMSYDVKGLSPHIPFYRSNWTLRAGVRARRALTAITRQQRLDAIFFHTQVPATLNLDWLQRVPSIISLDATPIQYDDLGLFYGHQPGKLWVEILKWRLSRMVFQAAQHIVTWSEWARQSLIQDYAVSPQHVTVVAPGVNVAEWQRPQPRVRHTRPVKILFVGGDLERKGGKLLIEAFRRLRPTAELHLVTRDQVAPEPGLFFYHAMQPNSAALKQLYFDCDIFALPTYGDCLPMVLSEAGAAGMAIISTRVAAIPEIIRDGETGLLVPTGDGAALAAALERLVSMPELRLRLGERAVDHVSQVYNTQTNTLRLLELLKHEADQARHAVRVA